MFIIVFVFLKTLDHVREKFRLFRFTIFGLGTNCVHCVDNTDTLSEEVKGEARIESVWH